MKLNKHKISAIIKEYGIAIVDRAFHKLWEFSEHLDCTDFWQPLGYVLVVESDDYSPFRN